MVKIQIDLNKEQDKKVSIIKIRNELITKADAIKHLINKSKEV